MSLGNDVYAWSQCGYMCLMNSKMCLLKDHRIIRLILFFLVIIYMSDCNISWPAIGTVVIQLDWLAQRTKLYFSTNVFHDSLCTHWLFGDIKYYKSITEDFGNLSITLIYQHSQLQMKANILLVVMTFLKQRQVFKRLSCHNRRFILFMVYHFCLDVKLFAAFLLFSKSTNEYWNTFKR